MPTPPFLHHFPNKRQSCFRQISHAPLLGSERDAICESIQDKRRERKGRAKQKQKTLHSVIFEFHYKDYTGVYSKGKGDLYLHQNKICLKAISTHGASSAKWKAILTGTQIPD